MCAWRSCLASLPFHHCKPQVSTTTTVRPPPPTLVLPASPALSHVDSVHSPSSVSFAGCRLWFTLCCLPFLSLCVCMCVCMCVCVCVCVCSRAVCHSSLVSQVASACAEGIADLCRSGALDHVALLVLTLNRIPPSSQDSLGARGRGVEGQRGRERGRESGESSPFPPFPSLLSHQLPSSLSSPPPRLPSTAAACSPHGVVVDTHRNVPKKSVLASE